MARLRRAIVLLCLLAASMPMLLPFAFAARSGDGAAVQVLCTTHGTMWVVVGDDGGSPDDGTRYVQGAACPLCAAGAHASAAPGLALRPPIVDTFITERAHEPALTLSVRHPWRLQLSSRAPPLA